MITIEDFYKVEIHILGTDSRQGVVLLTPMEPVENGGRVF